MAAEVLSQHGIAVDLYDAMPSVARKFLLAGRGGLNLTHAEAPERFLTRYGSRHAEVGRWLAAFGPTQLRAWTHELGIATFVGSSGRVFPAEMKAAPLLRAWLHRLRQAGVRFHARHRWLGWTPDGQSLRFVAPSGELAVTADACLLALGGGSWARLGSDGAWVPLLEAEGVIARPLKPANCGFNVTWSEHLRQRFAGQPVKNLAASLDDDVSNTPALAGEFMVTRHGIEGGLVYALAAGLRDRIEARGCATLRLDLLPSRPQAQLLADLERPRGRDSLANHLRRKCGIDGITAALLREVAQPGDLEQPAKLATLIKALPLRLDSPRPLDEAISSAGGVDFSAVDEGLMLRALPGVFCAGEMLDWEAPTGGYLLTACMASGRFAAGGIVRWLAAATSRQER